MSVGLKESDFEKIRIVGRGAYGVCWLCKNKKKEGEKVIVKTIMHAPGEEDTIMNEVKYLKSLSHPMIIGYYDSFKKDDSQVSIGRSGHVATRKVPVMQYAEGGTLERLIQDQREPFAPNVLLNYFTQIVISLNHMHNKSIVHRDLKTQNILLNRKKTLVMLSDFGISKELSTRSNLAHTVIGTPNYLSPEICEGRAYNQKSDIWSLGCILYELLVRRRAFEGENLPAIVMKITKAQYAPLPDKVDIHIREMLESLLNLNEGKRPSTKDIMTSQLLLPHVLTVHLDIGRLTVPEEKRKTSVFTGGKLRTTPMQTMRSPSPLVSEPVSRTPSFNTQR